MRDDYRKIIIRRIMHQSSADQSANPSPANRWLFYLTLIPTVIVVVVLGAFFFSIVLALFTAVAAAVGARLWWVQRKLRQAMKTEAQRNEENGAIIEDAEIIEIKEDNKWDNKR